VWEIRLAIVSSFDSQHIVAGIRSDRCSRAWHV
jgi:hypothetical protein